MRLRLFTPRQRKADIQTTSQEWKPDSEVIINYDDLYVRAWESEYETLIFDNDQHEPDSDNSLDVSRRHDLITDETCSIPGIIQEDSPEIFPHTVEVGEGTYTDHYIEPGAGANPEQMSPIEVNPRSTKYDLRHKLKPICNEDYRYYISNLSWYGTRNNNLHHMWIWKIVTERLRGTYVPTHPTPSITSGTASDC